MLLRQPGRLFVTDEGIKPETENRLAIDSIETIPVSLSSADEVLNPETASLHREC